MFCNGPRTDEGDIAHLELTTIAGMMSLKVLFVLDHDCGRYRWFGWPHQLPPYSWGRPNLQTVVGIWGGLFIFAQKHILGWVWLDILHIYIYMSLPFLFFFFFFFFFVWRLGLCSALMAHWWRGTRCGHVFDFDWLGSLVSGGNLFSFPAFSKAKGILIFIFPFCSPSLLLLSYFPSTCGFSNFLRCAFHPLSSQFPPNFKVRSLFKLFSFLNFCLLNSFSLFFSAFSFDK